MLNHLLVCYFNFKLRFFYSSCSTSVMFFLRHSNRWRSKLDFSSNNFCNLVKLLNLDLRMNNFKFCKYFCISFLNSLHSFNKEEILICDQSSCNTLLDVILKFSKLLLKYFRNWRVLNRSQIKSRYDKVICYCTSLTSRYFSFKKLYFMHNCLTFCRSEAHSLHNTYFSILYFSLFMNST